MAQHCWHQYGSVDSAGSRNVSCCFCDARAVQHVRPLKEAMHGPHLAGREYLPVQYPGGECQAKREVQEEHGGRRTVELMENK